MIFYSLLYINNSTSVILTQHERIPLETAIVFVEPIRDIINIKVLEEENNYAIPSIVVLASVVWQMKYSSSRHET
jgi:hypothetical protein